MKEMGMGNDIYEIVDIDNYDKINSIEECVKELQKEWTPDKYNTFPGRNKTR